MSDQIDVQAPLTEPPQWPKVVGIISIVWAALLLTCTGFGLIMMLLMPMLTKSAEQQLGPMPEVMKPAPAQMALAALGLIGPVLLLVAGIFTLRRKSSGRGMHLAYAILSIVLSVPGLFLGFKQQERIKAWAHDNPDSKWAQQANSPFQAVGMACGVVLGFGWPLFCLGWFGAAGKRPEVGAELARAPVI